ncbi:MAG TPA: hypothetical protein VG733_09320 [Chthoniobacteraceae bacterium]|nr:hypothetical protein [Chthoniobacteraceae bacterium]
MARGDRQRMDDKSLQDLRASIELAMWNYRFTGEFASEIAGNRSGGYDMETGSFTAYGMPSWIAIHSPMQDAAWQAQSHVDLIVESNPGALTAHINPFARLPEIPWQQEATMPPPLPVVLNVGVPIVRLGWPRSEPPPVALTGASCIPLAWNECSDNPTDFVVKLLQSHPAGDKKTSAIKIAPNASLNDILRETSLPHAAKGKLAILTFQDPDYTFPGFGGIPRFLSATKYWLVRTLDGRVGILQTIDRRESDRESFSIRWQMIEKGSADTASERK